MRLAVIIALVVLAAVPCAAAEPIAVWTPEKADGLRIVTAEDGQWDRVSIAGRDAVKSREGTKPASLYIYFALSPELRPKSGADLYLVVDFRSESVNVIGAQYNSPDADYASAKGFITSPDGKWDRALVRLTSAGFRGAQNGGADFRLVSSPRFAVSKIEVFTEKPDVHITTDQERIMKATKAVKAPKDMYYTLGCDIDESQAMLYKLLGVTSIESYVTWETCERKGKDQWDWSQWDKTVKILQDNGLKWVPFLILSPAYSTPDWFRASNEHVPCRCLEHSIDSKIESLWNPHLPGYIDRFIGEFAKRYRDTGVIESVLLGIQGDFGEAIYSVWGGGWTFNVPGEYHNHAGYWCDDPYAKVDFRRFVEARYKTAEAVNKAWGTEYASLRDVDFPGRKEELAAFEKQLPSQDPHIRRRWLDFMEWYRGAMTDWSDWWMGMTKKHFPNTPIYLCTGGDAEPHHGSNFAEQCRVAAKHGAGVRITNEASDYSKNFMVTRWVAAAGKHYGAFYGFEPAGAEDEKGIVARIYNATASGANQLHDYAPNVTQSEGRMDVQRAHLKYLFSVKKPVVPVALWYPNVYLTLHWSEFLHPASELRDYTDFDYVDETMLRTGALDKYKVLVIIAGPIMETPDAQLIADWVRKGGRVIIKDVDHFESVEGGPEPDRLIFGCGGEAKCKGLVTPVQGWDGVAGQLRKDLSELGLPVYDLAADGIYGTQIGRDRFLFLNTTDKDADYTIEWGGKTHKAAIKAGTITDVRVR